MTKITREEIASWKKEKGLNTKVKTVIRAGIKYEIDRLEDSKGLGIGGGFVYHIYCMDCKAAGVRGSSQAL